jgi:hypothetical protein
VLQELPAAVPPTHAPEVELHNPPPVQSVLEAHGVLLFVPPRQRLSAQNVFVVSVIVPDALAAVVYRNCRSLLGPLVSFSPMMPSLAVPGTQTTRQVPPPAQSVS